MPEPKSIKDRIEPAVMATGDGYQASIAISLKRIADNQEETNRLLTIVAEVGQQFTNCLWEGTIGVRDATRR